ncbi:MAG: hypothetical protein LRY20_01605 [Acholeplasmataceae bacterium]|nr:hypothetical protein [Acholeplasmataceae bacterium]
MKSMTRKLLLSVMAVVLSVIALGTTTFAWFTITNVANVQPFNAEVISDEGIEIAIGTGTPMELEWKTTLTTQDIYDYIASVHTAGFFFNHLTSVDGRNFTTLGTSGPGVGSTEGLLELPLHFRSDSTSEINWTQVVLSGTTESFTTRVGFTDSKGVAKPANSTYYVNAADAIRVSLSGNVASILTTVVYENPSSLTNTVLDARVAADFRGTQEDVLGVPTYIGVNGAVNYFYRSNAMLPGGADAVTVVDTIQDVTLTKVLDMTAGSLATAEREYYGTLTVRVWFEGWDAEAYNSLLGKTVTLSLRFEG